MFLSLVFFSCFFTFLWFIFIKSPLFVIKDIVVGSTGISSVLEQDIKTILDNKFLGKSIFIRKKEMADMIYANFPMVKEALLEIKSPSEIVVKIKQREPFSYIKTDLQEEYYILDFEGVVLGVSDSFKGDMPLIKYTEGMVFSGKKLSEGKISSALTFLKELKELGIVVSSCVIDDKIVITSKSPVIEVVIPVILEGMEREKAILLQKIIQKYSIEGREIKRIDMRFSNPIIDF